MKICWAIFLALIMLISLLNGDQIVPSVCIVMLTLMLYRN